MKTTYITMQIVFSIFFLTTQVWASGKETFFQKTDRFLAAHVKNGRVDYQAIQKNPAALNALVEIIANFDLSTLPEGDPQKAFWLNAYNVLVIKGIINNYPTKSPLDIDGFFNKIPYPAAGKELTLDNIENDIIRPTYKDARIHFALVCAAKGCPPIITSAFHPATLDEQLDENTRNIINDNNFIRVDTKNKQVAISQIFEWFAVDFEINDKTTLDFINQYRAEKLPADTKIAFYDYDWALNEL